MTMKMARVIDVRDSAGLAPASPQAPLTGERHIADILSRYPAVADAERHLLHAHADKHGVGQMRRSFVSRGLGPQLIAFERDYRPKSAATGGWAGLILAAILGVTLLQALH